MHDQVRASEGAARAHRCGADVCRTARISIMHFLRARPDASTRLFRLTEKLEEHCARRGIEMPEFKKKERGQLRVSL
jgi:hypothetical protein